MQHPEHEDKAADTLRNALMIGCSWLQYCLYMTHKLPINDKDYPIYYPVLESKDYCIITPDNEVNLGLFTLNENVEFNNNDEPIKYNMSFIFWFDQRKITSTIYEDITNGLMNEVIKILKRNCCDTIKKETNFENIFDYSGIDLKKLYLFGNNFKAFKLTFNYYQIDCNSSFSQTSYT